MVVLLVTHNVNHLVDGIIAEAQLSCTDILCHIYRCAVATQQQLLVESVLCEVGPHRAILATIEDALLEATKDSLFTNEICIRFVIYLVEAYTECLVGIVEALIHPAVHGAPQVANLFVALLPFHEHVACLGHECR